MRLDGIDNIAREVWRKGGFVLKLNNNLLVAFIYEVLLIRALNLQCFVNSVVVCCSRLAAGDDE